MHQNKFCYLTNLKKKEGMSAHWIKAPIYWILACDISIRIGLPQATREKKKCYQSYTYKRFPTSDHLLY